MGKTKTPFNTPLETGVRALAILDAMFPSWLDLQRLVQFDYLVVHSGDAGGPESLHPPVPLRTGELLVRREIIEKGLLLMMSRDLVRRVPSPAGIHYQASDKANAFLSALTAGYIAKLRERAAWIADRFADVTDEEIKKTTRRLFRAWTMEFHQIERSHGEEG
ncbi:MAG: ABC-three component system middle component 2 [Thermodesulfobacteriota bacterium]